MDADGENADRDDFHAVLTLSSGERITIRNFEEAVPIRLQADGFSIGFSFTAGRGGRPPSLRLRIRADGDVDSVARWKQVDRVRSGVPCVDLTDPAWSKGNPDDIRACWEGLLAAFEADRALAVVIVGEHLLANLEETDQRRTFHAMLDRPSLSAFRLLGSRDSPETIHTSALLESLTRSRNDLQKLMVRHVRVKNRLEVGQLAGVLRTRGGVFKSLALGGLVSIVEEHPLGGFLDPLVDAMTSCANQPRLFTLEGYLHEDIPPRGLPSLVSPAALRSYLQVYADFSAPAVCSLHLEKLGLGDEHCKAIGELLVPMNGSDPGRSLSTLSLLGNGAIGEKGYEALLVLLNRNHFIQNIFVDDESWQETFDLVAHMNNKYGRGEFMKDGVFAGKAEWVDWLAKLANLPPTEDEVETNSLWYTLRNKPCFISN
jgi:hypothetical protein